MATDTLQQFIEDRLLAFDPTIDLEDGSPAQVQFIAPLLEKLGSDPIETPIQDFISDRLRQSLPTLYSGSAAAIEDGLIKPLLLLLEPFQRKFRGVKTNQSLRDPSLLSDDDADALIANVFEERPSGGFSGGIVRVFFTNPVNQSAEVTCRAYTDSGLGYYPTSPVSVTAEEMAFNRQGGLYFMDIPMKAEKEGDEYNIDKGEIRGISGMAAAVSATNPRAFRDGATRVDTPSLVVQARDALSERSLVTRRGGTALTKRTFGGSIRALQVVGAGDPEMQRDILVATSPGHAWLQGSVGIYGSVAFVRCRTVDDFGADQPLMAGSELFVFLDKSRWPSIGKRFIRLKVEEVIYGPMTESDASYLYSYLVRWSDAEGSLPALPAAGLTLEGGFIKKGVIKVSSLPSVGSTDLTVANQEVHVLGHSDFYVRPAVQKVAKTTIDSLADDPGTKFFRLERTTLSTTAGSNTVTDTVDFVTTGVEEDDLLVVESGADVGTYRVGRVSYSNGVGSLVLGSTLSATAASIRYRVIKKLHVDPFDPCVPRLPFGGQSCNDLQTTIGSADFVFSSSNTDLVGFGAKVGDTIRVTRGVDAGDFTVTKMTDGRHVTVDRKAGGTDSALTYEVLTPLAKVELPLVRLRQIMLLDSSKQATGIKIPPADPVAVVPAADFTSAATRGYSQRRSGFVLPDLTSVMDPLPLEADYEAVGGGRYTRGFDQAVGHYGPVAFEDQTHDEFDYRPDLFNACRYFVATAEETDKAENFPPIAPKAGECLTIKNGPNRGSYLIEDVLKFRYKTAGGSSVWAYLIRIYGEFPVDVFKSLFGFLNDANKANGADSEVTPFDYSSTELSVPGALTSLYESLPQKTRNALLSYGSSAPSLSELKDVIDALALVDYEWGDPARGVLRAFFTSPTLFEQRTGKNASPTIFSLETAQGEVLKFLPNPNCYGSYELVPARLSEDADPLDYPRDLDASSGLQGGATVTLTDSSRLTLFRLGIRPGDFLAVHEEVFFHGSTGAGGDRQTAVQTVANSTQVTFINNDQPYTSDMVANLVFLEEGADRGAYRVSKVDGTHLTLDRPLTASTPAAIATGKVSRWGLDGDGKSYIEASEGSFTGVIDPTNKYLTLYGIDSKFQGSYKVLSAASSTRVEVDRSGFGTVFPAIESVAQGVGFWILTDAPAAEPKKTGNPTAGTELVGVCPIRMYNDIPHELEIADVEPSPTVSKLYLPDDSIPAVKMGIGQPWRVYRKNLRRITPAEMSQNRFGALYYFDTEVVSLGNGSHFNIPKSSYLTVNEGTFRSWGYRHQVDDFTLSYSMKESGTLELPTSILPVGLADSLENFVPLIGTPVEITYERGEIVEELQEFLDSPEDRVTTANMLARHFLPAYVSYDATYYGGSAPSVIAKDIISYVDNLTVESPLDVSVMQDKIGKRGGNPETPTTAIVLLHDWDRKVWAEFSENKLGGDTTDVPYHGTPRVSFFVPGQDLSGQEDIPDGERINLVRG